jgi:hypothetical protein
VSENLISNGCNASPSSPDLATLEKVVKKHACAWSLIEKRDAKMVPIATIGWRAITDIYAYTKPSLCQGLLAVDTLCSCHALIPEGKIGL